MAFRRFRKTALVFAEQQTEGFEVLTNPHADALSGVAGDWIAHAGDPQKDSWVIQEKFMRDNYVEVE